MYDELWSEESTVKVGALDVRILRWIGCDRTYPNGTPCWGLHVEATVIKQIGTMAPIDYLIGRSHHQHAMKPGETAFATLAPFWAGAVDESLMLLRADIDNEIDNEIKRSEKRYQEAQVFKSILRDLDAQ